MSSETIKRLREISDSLIDPDFAVQLFENGYPDAVVVVAEDGTIKLVNRHVELMFGYHRSELYDRPIETLIPEDRRSKHAEHRDRYRLDPQPRPMGLGMVLQGVHKSGHQFEVEISLSPIVAHQGSFTVATVRRRR